MDKFLEPGHALLDSFEGTLLATNACLVVEKHRCLVVYGNDSRCWERSMPSLMEAYAFQLLNQASDVAGNEEIMEAGRVHLEALKGRRLKDSLDSWAAQLDCPLTRHSKSKWCLTFALHTRITLCITGFDTCHTRCDLKCRERDWRALTLTGCFRIHVVGWEWR